MTRQPRLTKCPSCGGANVAEILYGFIIPDAKLNEALKRGRVVLGGCCVTGHDPEWHCNACGAEFRSSGPDACNPKPQSSYS